MSVQRSADFLSKTHLARKLLSETLPKMQPSALKHEYLSSVANALNHPVASEVDEHGVTYAIGFGDFSRTLPLLLIIETQPDCSVRHAYVPNLNNKRDARLVRKLQEHEHQWARQRGLPRGRDIIAELRYYSRETINQIGIARYPAPPPFNDDDHNALMRGEWFRTRAMPQRLEVDHSGSPKLDSPSGDDYGRITTNIAESVNMNTATRAPKARKVHVQTPPRSALRLSEIEFDNDPPTGVGPEL